MVQGSSGVESERQSGSERGVDRTLSTESKRQRESPKNTGAFGRRTGHSDLIFFEGILPERDGRVLNSHSIEKQASAALDRFEAMLERRNKTVDAVLKVEIQLTDLEDAGVVDRAYESRFADIALPPRTVVGVCSLPGDANIQFDMIAADE